MRLAPTLALLALATATAAPAFAGDLTGFKITKSAADPCKINVVKVYQEGTGGPIHAVIANSSKNYTVGKLTSTVKVGRAITMDGANFTFNGTGNPILDLVVNKKPKGTATGADVMLAFTECTVAMH